MSSSINRLILVVAAACMALLVAVSQVQAAQINQLQLENSSGLDPSAHDVVDDPTATPGETENAVKFLADVPVVENETMPETLDKIEVVARGTGSVQAKLLVNGSSYAPAFAVNSSTHESYMIDGADLAAKDYNFEIKSKGSAPGNRLFVDKLIFHGAGSTTPDPDPQPVDTDGDGVNDDVDNCPADYNGGQADIDGDGVGNVCDPDKDGDGVPNGDDPAPKDPTIPGDTTPDPDPEPVGNTWAWNAANADVVVKPGDDIDQKLNGANSGDVVRVESDGDGEYTYNMSQEVRLAEGVKVRAEPGTFELVGGRAYKMDPAVKLNANFTADQALSLTGNNEVRGFEMTGLSTQDPGSRNCAGKGMFVAAGNAPNSFMEFNYIHDNPSLGVAGYRGKFLRNEVEGNGTQSWATGCNSGGIKSRFEFEAGHNFVHDHPYGNGIWTDNGTEDDPQAANDAWMHDNVTVNNGSAGIRIEETPDIDPASDPNEIAVTVEDNISGGNSEYTGRADIHVHDSANVLVRNNSVGHNQSVSGYSQNVTQGTNINGLRASDSCRTDRPDLGDPQYGAVRLVNNDLNGQSRISVEEKRYNDGDVILQGNDNVHSLNTEGSNSCG